MKASITIFAYFTPSFPTSVIAFTKSAVLVSGDNCGSGYLHQFMTTASAMLLLAELCEQSAVTNTCHTLDKLGYVTLFSFMKGHIMRLLICYVVHPKPVSRHGK